VIEYRIRSQTYAEKKYQVFNLAIFGPDNFPLSAAAGRPGQPDSRAEASGQAESFFPVSVWYTGGKVRAPMIENVTPASAAIWKKDLEQIKKLGFNTVRCWIEWSYNEKQEGQYDFSALKLLTDLAGQVGLKVICQVYIDSAPDWVGQKYPESAFVASNDLKIHSQAAPGFCFDHPQVQAKIINF